MFGFSIIRRSKLEELRTNSEIDKMQLKLANESTVVAVKTHVEKLNKLSESLTWAEQELNRRQGTIDKLHNEASQREETIRLLNDELKSLQRFVPRKGAGGRYVKKTVSSN